MNWQPIDTAPLDGTEILATDYDCIDIIHSEGRYWENREGEFFYPCFWQSLPNVPDLPEPTSEELTNATTEDCCDAWVAIRHRLGWYQFDDDPGVYAMPCVAGTLFRVNYCPICGAQRRSVIWNSNTHPPLSEEN